MQKHNANKKKKKLKAQQKTKATDDHETDADDALLAKLENQRRELKIAKQNKIALYINNHSKHLVSLKIELLDDPANDMVLALHDALNKVKCRSFYIYYSAIDHAVRSGIDFFKLLISTQDLTRSLDQDDGLFSLMRSANFWIAET